MFVGCNYIKKAPKRECNICNILQKYVQFTSIHFSIFLGLTKTPWDLWPQAAWGPLRQKPWRGEFPSRDGESTISDLKKHRTCSMNHSFRIGFCIFVCIYIYVQIYIYIYIYIRTYIYTIYVHIYIYIFILYIFYLYYMNSIYIYIYIYYFLNGVYIYIYITYTIMYIHTYISLCFFLDC